MSQAHPSPARGSRRAGRGNRYEGEPWLEVAVLDDREGQLRRKAFKYALLLVATSREEP